MPEDKARTAGCHPFGSKREECRLITTIICYQEICFLASKNMSCIQWVISLSAGAILVGEYFLLPTIQATVGIKPGFH